ncbi:deoxyribose-phosphate aldolase [Christiangramia fulva]|uniref:Deoxyribose-phosphate aldolase n=1 Tax=Christiangramia fulva TaxID=2126553 RepID=A0A2R3Z252_9FLAO|nr:deoxyribose-phosphate aldolase [Christiangramia fulva]AVR44361.1 deoxyribose-phosphate aldolase [Christiangramia fulva]
MDLNTFIDHTLLTPTATEKDIQTLCEEAVSFKFYAVCVNTCYVKFAKEQLAGSEVKVAATVGFPLGASSSKAKITEAEEAVKAGADEIDMVINLGYAKDGHWEKVKNEIAAIKKAIGDSVLKVIIETCYLSEHEIRKACETAMEANADFVKTSTGFGSRGASFDDVKIMKEVVGEKLKIKASGGIRDAGTAKKYIELGVSRIGTSSGKKIVSEA